MNHPNETTPEGIAFDLRTDGEWHRAFAEHAALGEPSPSLRRPRSSWRQRLRSLLITALIIVIGGPLIGFAILALIHWPGYAVGAAIALTGLVAIVRLVHVRQVKRMLAIEVPLREGRIVLGADGLCLAADDAPLHAWPEVKRVELCSHGLLVRLVDHRGIWLPASALASGSMDDVRALVKRYAPKVWVRSH